ncbi:12919_t:CDS:2 [Entrophospora sp. SA101]|nr:12919_t:CDS:2 [Entrophospora sp. SA101]
MNNDLVRKNYFEDVAAEAAMLVIKLFKLLVLVVEQQLGEYGGEIGEGVSIELEVLRKN